MAALTGFQRKDTYKALLKFSDNDVVTSTLKTITDGLGNSIPMDISTTKIKITGCLEVSKNGAANAPAIYAYGTVYTGGTATTTKPYWLVETTGATSSGWSTLGTYLGINASSGFTGNIFDGQLNGASRFKVDYAGNVTAFGNLLPTTSYATNIGSTSQIWNNIYGYTFNIYNGRMVITETSNNGLISTMSNLILNPTNLVTFHGTTSSFPALKRSTTYLQGRLADDSGFCFLQGKLTTDNAYVASVQTPTGYIVIYDNTGTAYKVSVNV